MAVSFRPAAFLMLMLQALTALSQDDADSFQPMFNGRDLTGWVLVNTPADTWSTEDGLLICSGRPIGELRTEKMYQNFILELEWRHMVPRGNAGIFIWADDLTARGVPFHRGIEIQVLENAYGNTRSHTTHGDIFPIHGATMTPVNGRGGQRAFPSEERSRPSPEWNHYRIEARDGVVTLAVNGKVVTKGTDCRPRKGYICIESEGGVVQYRNMRIRELPPTEISDELTAIADRGYRSVYSGLDLRNWTVVSGDVSNWQPKDWVLKYDSESEGTVSCPLSPSVRGWLCDLRCGSPGAALQVTLRDAEGRRLEWKFGEDSGQGDGRPSWSRLECAAHGGRWSVTRDGEEVSAGELPSGFVPSEWTLTARGPLDLANLFVRDRQPSDAD